MKFNLTHRVCRRLKSPMNPGEFRLTPRLTPRLTGRLTGSLGLYVGFRTRQTEDTIFVLE